MHILFLSTVYPHPTAPVRGTFNWELCHALNAMARVRVVSPRSWMEVLRYGNVRQSELDTRVQATWPCFLYPPKVVRHALGRFMWWSIKRHVRRVLAQFPAQWVVSYWAHPDGQAALKAAREIGARAAVIVGGSDVLLLPRSPRRKQCVLEVLTQSDAVICVCEGLRQHVIALGVNPARVHTLYQGIERHRFRHGDRKEARERLSLPPHSPIYLWVGRMVDVKRLDLLVRAFAYVRARHHDARLYLAGTGSALIATKQLVQSLHLADGVTFAGAIAPADLPAWYQAADATVLSSSSEGLPNVLRESLACGTPFVSTNVGSIAEIADPTNSILVPSGDETALAAAMIDILDPLYASGARAYVPKSWADSATELMRILRAESSAGSESTVTALSAPLDTAILESQL